MLIPTITCPALWRVLIISNCLITLRNKSCGKSCERHLSKANIVSTCPSFVSLLFHNKLLQKQYSWTEKKPRGQKFEYFFLLFFFTSEKKCPLPSICKINKSYKTKFRNPSLYPQVYRCDYFSECFSLPYPFFPSINFLNFWTFCFSLFFFFQFPLIWVCSATIWWKKYYYKINKKDTIHT